MSEDCKEVKEVVQEKAKKAFLLFSGGYDSTAVLLKLIESCRYSEITVAYESAEYMPDGYKNTGYNKALRLFGGCYSYDSESFQGKERDDYESGKKWFFNDDEKSRETASAIAFAGLFDQDGMKRIFSAKSCEDIQKEYDKRHEKEPQVVEDKKDA